jgi:hypothetical protein
MPPLFDAIHQAVGNGRYVVSIHADLRLRERHIEAWQVEAAMPDALLLRERPHTQPNPGIEAKIMLPDGTSAKVIWAWLERAQAAKIVSVHFFDR